MTTTTEKESAEDLVDRIMSSMRKAASSGDPAAAEELERLSSREGKATEPAEKVKHSTPEPGVLEVSELEIIRPNGETYHVRRLGPHHDVAVLRAALVNGTNPLLVGPPGTGKTALIEAAYCHDGPVYTLQGSGDTEVADFVGGFVQMPDNTFKWVDGPFVRAMEEGRPFYVDEIALIDPKVMAIVYGVMDGRDELRITQNPERGVVKAQPGFFVVAACNPNAPGARMSEALLSRFDLQFEVTTDYKLAKRLGVHSKVVTAAQNLAGKFEAGEVSWAPQLRELLAYKRIETMLGEDTALRNLIATAPEIDRDLVKDVVSRAFSKPLDALKVV